MPGGETDDSDLDLLHFKSPAPLHVTPLPVQGMRGVGASARSAPARPVDVCSDIASAATTDEDEHEHEHEQQQQQHHLYSEHDDVPLGSSSIDSDLKQRRPRRSQRPPRPASASAGPRVSRERLGTTVAQTSSTSSYLVTTAALQRRLRASEEQVARLQSRVKSQQQHIESLRAATANNVSKRRNDLERSERIAPLRQRAQQLEQTVQELTQQLRASRKQQIRQNELNQAALSASRDAQTSLSETSHEAASLRESMAVLRAALDASAAEVSDLTARLQQEHRARLAAEREADRSRVMLRDLRASADIFLAQSQQMAETNEHLRAVLTGLLAHSPAGKQ